jgi:hypothetical protein
VTLSTAHARFQLTVGRGGTHAVLAIQDQARHPAAACDRMLRAGAAPALGPTPVVTSRCRLQPPRPLTVVAFGGTVASGRRTAPASNKVEPLPMQRAAKAAKAVNHDGHPLRSASPWRPSKALIVQCNGAGPAGPPPFVLPTEPGPQGPHPDLQLPNCCTRSPWRLGHDTGVTSPRTASVSLLTRLHRTDDLPITRRSLTSD